MIIPNTSQYQIKKIARALEAAQSAEDFLILKREPFYSPETCKEATKLLPNANHKLKVKRLAIEAKKIEDNIDSWTGASFQSIKLEIFCEMKRSGMSDKEQEDFVHRCTGKKKFLWLNDCDMLKLLQAIKAYNIEF